MSIHNMPDYDRERALHQFKKCMAGCGCIAGGSMLMFIIAGWLIFCADRADCEAAVISFAIVAILGWGVWGLMFLKTRH